MHYGSMARRLSGRGTIRRHVAATARTLLALSPICNDEESTLFRSVFTNRQPYSSFEASGIHFTLLNTHEDGHYERHVAQGFGNGLQVADRRDREAARSIWHPGLKSPLQETQYGVSIAERRQLGAGRYGFAGQVYLCR